MGSLVEVEEWVSPLVNFTKTSTKRNGVSIFPLSEEIRLNSEIPLKYNKKLYMTFVSGEKKAEYFSNNKSQLSNQMEFILDESMSLFYSHFEMSEDLEHIYTSPLFHLFVILESLSDANFMGLEMSEERHSFRVISAVLFNHNPQSGTFVPAIIVRPCLRGQKFGVSTLMLLQFLYYKRFQTQLMMLWIYVDDNSASKNLMGFYRRLGFYPIPARYQCFQYLLRRELYLDLIGQLERGKEEESNNDDNVSKNSGSLCSYDINNQHNFILCTRNKIIYHDPAVRETVFLNKKVVEKNLRCELCGLERDYATDIKVKGKSSAADFFLYCQHPMPKSRNFLSDIKRNESDPQSVCGVTFCFTCVNSFRLSSVMYCPMHVGNYKSEDSLQRPRSVFTLRLMKSFTNKFLQSSDGRAKFFSSYMENVPTMNKTSCQKCLYDGQLSVLKQNDNRVEEMEVSASRAFARYKFISDNREVAMSKLINNFHTSTDSACFNMMDRMCFRNHGIKPCSGGKLHGNIFFDSNAGKGCSALTNDVFGVHLVDGMGDCGFDSVLIALNSAEESLKKKIVRCFHSYITSQRTNIEFLKDSIAHVEDSDKIKKKKNNKKAKASSDVTLKTFLETRDLREAFFLSKFDMDLHDYIDDDMYIESFFQDFRDYKEEFEEYAPGFKYLSSEECTNKENLVVLFQSLYYARKEKKANKNKSQKKFNLKTALNKIMEEKSYPYMVDTIKKLNDIYLICSTDTEKGGMVTELIWMDTFSLHALPYITNGLVGALIVNDRYSKLVANQHLSSEIHDNGYCMMFKDKKHVMKECEYFILLRHLDDCHYEVMYDRNNCTAIFPTMSVQDENIVGRFHRDDPNPIPYIKNNSSLMPFWTVKKFVSPDNHFQLFGTTTDWKVNFKEIAQIKEYYEKRRSSKKIRGNEGYPSYDANISSAIGSFLGTKGKDNLSFLYPEWINTTRDLSEKWSTKNFKSDLDISRLLISALNDDSFFPIFLNQMQSSSSDEDSEYENMYYNEKKLHTLMLFVQNSDEREISNNTSIAENSYDSSTNAKAMMVKLLDGNKVPINKTNVNPNVLLGFGIEDDHDDKNNFIELDIVKLMECFNKNLWRFPTEKDINNISRVDWYNLSKAKDMFEDGGIFVQEGCLEKVFGIIPTTNVDESLLKMLEKRSKHMCFTEGDFLEKQRFYCYFIAFHFQDYQVYRHMLVNNEASVISLVKDKYKEILDQSFIMNSNEIMIKNYVLKTFSPMFQDQSKENEFLTTAAKEMFVTLWDKNNTPFTGLLHGINKNSFSIGLSSSTTESVNDDDSSYCDKTTPVQNVPSSALVDKLNPKQPFTKSIEPTPELFERVDKVMSSTMHMKEVQTASNYPSLSPESFGKGKASKAFCKIARSEKFGKIALTPKEQTYRRGFDKGGFATRYTRYLRTHDFDDILKKDSEKTLISILIPLVFHERINQKFIKLVISYFKQKYNVQSGFHGGEDIIKCEWTLVRNALLSHMGLQLIRQNPIKENKSLFDYEITDEVRTKFLDELRENSAEIDDDCSDFSSVDTTTLFPNNKPQLNMTSLKEDIATNLQYKKVCAF